MTKNLVVKLRDSIVVALIENGEVRCAEARLQNFEPRKTFKRLEQDLSDLSALPGYTPDEERVIQHFLINRFVNC